MPIKNPIRTPAAHLHTKQSKVATPMAFFNPKTLFKLPSSALIAQHSALRPAATLVFKPKTKGAQMLTLLSEHL